MLKHGCEADSAAELRQEKIYVAYLFVLQGCIYFPFMVAYVFDSKASGLEDASLVPYFTMALIYLILQYAWIAGVTFMIHFMQQGAEPVSQAAIKYRNQNLRFMAVFLVMTSQVLIVLLHQSCGDCLSLSSSGYLIQSGQFFFTFMVGDTR